MLFTLLIDDCSLSALDVWSVFFDLYITQPTFELIRDQARNLLAYSTDLRTWNKSRYGSYLRMVNTETIKILQRYWYQYSANIDFMDEYKNAVKRIHDRYYKDIPAVGVFPQALKRY